MPQENKKNISESVLQFSQRVGIDVTEFNVDGDVLEYAAGLIEELKSKYPNDPSLTNLSMYVSKFSEMPATIETLNGKVTQLEGEVAQFKKSSEVEQLVSQAEKDHKILPNQKPGLMKFGMASNKEALEEYIKNLPVIDIFKSNMVNKDLPAVIEVDKFKNADGSEVTFDQYCKAVGSRKAEDKELVARFSDEDIKKLPGYDTVNFKTNKK